MNTLINNRTNKIISRTNSERIEENPPLKALPKQKSEASHCHNCGNKIDKDTIICPSCGIEIT